MNATSRRVAGSSPLRRIEPALAPGGRIHVPRALLTPALGDPRLAPLTLGEPYPTLWRLAADGTTASGVAEVAPLVRNLQRLNAIVDPRKLHRGARIQVPWNLHAAKSPPAVPALAQDASMAPDQGMAPIQNAS